jgi:hypothetical protein
MRDALAELCKRCPRHPTYIISGPPPAGNESPPAIFTYTIVTCTGTLTVPCNADAMRKQAAGARSHFSRCVVRHVPTCLSCCRFEPSPSLSPVADHRAQASSTRPYDLNLAPRQTIDRGRLGAIRVEWPGGCLMPPKIMDFILTGVAAMGEMDRVCH